MRSIIKSFMLDENAATAVEYGLIIGFIALAIASSLTTLGTNLNSKFTKVGTGIGT